MVANLNPTDPMTPVVGADQRQANFDQQHGVMAQHLLVPDLACGQVEPQLTDIMNFIMTYVEIRLLDGKWATSNNQGTPSGS